MPMRDTESDRGAEVTSGRAEAREPTARAGERQACSSVRIVSARACARSGERRADDHTTLDTPRGGRGRGWRCAAPERGGAIGYRTLAVGGTDTENDNIEFVTNTSLLLRTTRHKRQHAHSSVESRACRYCGSARPLSMRGSARAVHAARRPTLNKKYSTRHCRPTAK